jgi:hypothetical protein
MEAEDTKMILSGKRKLGIAALVVAGLVAVAVPFIFLHGTSPQGTNPNPPTTSGNNGNNGSKASPGSGNNGGGGGNSNTGSSGGSTGDSSGSSGSNSGGSSGGSSWSCNETKTHDHDSDPHTNGNGEHNGNAYGVLKNKLDTTVALVKAMGIHDPAYHLHHDTDTDNDTIHGPHNISHDPADHDSSCASGEEQHDHD